MMKLISSMSISIILLLIKLLSCHSNNYCMDISNEKKEAIYKEFDSIYRKFNNEMMLLKVGPSSHNLPTIMGISSKMNNVNKDCQILTNKTMTRNSTYINERSTCPWEYRIKIRTNQTLSHKYPMHIREAHCLCDSCDSSRDDNKSVHNRCMPVLMSMPCLMRLDKCGSDGYYRWIPHIEQISVACVCTLMSLIS